MKILRGAAAEAERERLRQEWQRQMTAHSDLLKVGEALRILPYLNLGKSEWIPTYGGSMEMRGPYYLCGGMELHRCRTCGCWEPRWGCSDARSAEERDRTYEFYAAHPEAIRDPLRVARPVA